MNSFQRIFNLKVLSLIGVALFILAFSIHAHSDADLGWHLRYGQYFFSTGHVLKDNILTYVWPNYKWVQASWGYDLLVFQIFSIFGFPGLSFAAGLTTLLIFGLISWPQTKFKFWQIFFLASLFLTQAAPLYYTGFRSQTPSALFFTIVIIIAYQTLCTNKNTFISNKSFYLLPIIFLTWANMHGGFALGLGLISLMWAMEGIIFLYKRLKNKHFEPAVVKKWALFGVIIIFSSITPLINPWGGRIYEESFKHSSNTNLNYITEWRPTYIDYPQELAISFIFICFALLIFVIRRKITDLPIIIALLFNFLIAAAAVRFIITFGILLTYYLALVLPHLNVSLLKKSVFAYLLPILIIFLIVIDMFFTHRYFLFVSPVKIMNYNWADYCNEFLRCDENITEIMQKKLPVGRGFNPYDYGGYLEWRVPKIKIFMDGRMAAWEENGDTPPVIHGDDVFLDGSPGSFIKFNSQYHFHWVIIPTQASASRYLDALSKAGQWEKIYEGPVYSYYVKNTN